MADSSISGLSTVDLEKLSNEVGGLALYLECSTQVGLEDRQVASCLQHVRESIDRIAALIPGPPHLLDIDLRCRAQVKRLLECLNDLASTDSPVKTLREIAQILRQGVPRMDEFGNLRLTRLEREGFWNTYGGLPDIRKKNAHLPNDDVARIDLGIREAVRRFPQLRSWSVQEWTELFFCSNGVVEATRAWKEIAGATASSEKQHSVPTKAKRSTERGEGKAKLISALTEHHEYADGSCLNQKPIGNNELARRASVSSSTASAFFDTEFNRGETGGHAKYRAICLDITRLIASLKLLNQEFAPHHLFGDTPPGEDYENKD